MCGAILLPFHGEALLQQFYHTLVRNARQALPKVLTQLADYAAFDGLELKLQNFLRKWDVKD